MVLSTSGPSSQLTSSSDNRNGIANNSSETIPLEDGGESRLSEKHNTVVSMSNDRLSVTSKLADPPPSAPLMTRSREQGPCFKTLRDRTRLEVILLLLLVSAVIVLSAVILTLIVMNQDGAKFTQSALNSYSINGPYVEQSSKHVYFFDKHDPWGPQG